MTPTEQTVICKGKVRHASRKQAQCHLLAVQRRKGGPQKKADKRGLHVYQCPICQDWHIGHASLKYFEKGA